jgi:cardiolipin synthase
VGKPRLHLDADTSKKSLLKALTEMGHDITRTPNEWMAQIGASKSVAVSSLGKVKTVAQMIAIPMLLYKAPLFGVIDTLLVGTLLLYIAAVLTLWSMVYYLRRAWPLIKERPGLG